MKKFLCAMVFCLMVLCAGHAHAQSMVSGSTATGSVPAPPCTPSPCYDTQTFSGTAGHGIIITVADSFGGAAIAVYKPDGTLLSTSTTESYTYSSLPVSGTYSVRISSETTGYGAYTVYYVAGAEGVSNGSLTSGATADDSLPTSGLTSYTFDGTAGKGIQLWFTGGTESWNANIKVYTPDGAYWTGYDDSIVSNSLPQTGTYTVVLQGYYATDSGSYALSYFIGGGATSGGSLTSGGSVSGTMPLGQMTSYSFSGTAGRGIAISAGSMSWGTVMDVYTPDGHYWGYSTSNNFNTGTTNPLPQTGTYTVVFRPLYYTSGSGTYKMYFVEGGDTVSQSPTPFPSGEFDSDSLDSNQLRSYTFYGTAGRAISMHFGATYTGHMIAYTPDGHYWGASATNVYNNTSLPQTGNYTVVVYPNTYTSTAPGNYNFYYVQGDDSVSEGSLVSGHQRSGYMARNAIMSYTFAAEASKSITISSTCTFGTYGCYALLYKPDGSYWGTVGNSYSGTTPAVAGDYTLVLYEYLGTATGNYTITVTTAQPAPPPSTPSSCPFCGGSGGDPTVDSIIGAGLGGGGPAGAPSPGAAPGAPGGVLLAAASSILDYAVSKTGNTTKSSGTSINGRATFEAVAPGGGAANFDVGYKELAAVDYQAGGLTFMRVYRSDSTWTSNTIGALWRTNYARVFSVVGSDASITDGTGATVTYTLTGGVWVPDDSSTRATFQTVSGGYNYTLPNGTVEKYTLVNSRYQLTRVEYLAGGALNLTYNSSDQLTGVANENGRSLSFTYDGSGRISTMVTPDGTFSYSYDTAGNLTKVTKPDTNTIQYEYENATYYNALTGITDEKGVRYATFAYNSSGQLSSSELAGGVDEYTYSYDSTAGTSTVTNPLGKEFTYYYSNPADGGGARRIIEIDGAASTNTPASTEYFNYDKLGRMIGKTDWNNDVTRYEYDSRGNVTRIAQAVGTSDQRITTTAWNSTWNLPTLVTEPGKTTAFDYDSYGRLTSVTVTDTATSAARTTTYSYYSNSTDGSGNTILGRLETIDGPRTDVTDTTTYAYDSNFDLTTITNALSQVTTVTARDSAGRVTKFTDPNSIETDLSYDSNGWLQTVVQDEGGSLQGTTTFTYDADGQLTKLELPNSATMQYTYDNAQRLTEIEDTLGNTITYTLDNAGNKTQTQMDDTTPSLTYTHTRTFDELSRILTSVGASSQTADYAWDVNSNLTSYIDPNTNETDYTYDPLQRLATITDALSGVRTNGYDALNNLTSVEDQRSNSTTYTYNAFGDVTGETSPDRGTLSYTVDKAGNVTKRVDARSVETDYTYDALNRLTAVSYPASSSLDVSLTYDSSSGCGTPYKGHLCSVTDAAGTTAYEYDDLGRVTQQKDTRGSLNFTTDYTYDLAGNITGLTLPSGRTVTYTLNSNGQVSGVSAKVNGTDTTLASSITYLPFGPLKALTYGNSLTFSGTYDHDYNPTNRTVSGSIYNWTYTTDNNGNITQAGPSTYGYDALNRVDAENPGSSISYTYDATSNRLTKVSGGTTTTTVPSTSNKISAVGSNSYTYDAAGDITGDGTNAYTWNDEGELSEVKVGGSAVGDYTYNYERQRTEKVAGSNTTQFIYAAGGLLYGEYDSSGNLIREYVYLNGAPLAQIAAGSTETLTYLHTDHLGTPRFATDTSGSEVWSWTNDAFGTSAPSGSVTVNLRMPGQYYDSESGLFYNWNRYYNPAIGRYINSDPIGLAGGLNTFDYVKANPISYLDLLGWILFNPDGSIVFTPTGNIRHMTYPFPGPGSDFMEGWIYTDDHHQIRAYKNLDIDTERGFNADCHGTTFGGGQVWINDDQVAAILAGDHYRRIDTPQPGDVAIFSEGSQIVHSMTVESTTGGNILLYGKAGNNSPVSGVPVESAWSSNATVSYWRK